MMHQINISLRNFVETGEIDNIFDIFRILDFYFREVVS
ncbi:phage protein [Streptococcus equi subsp. equi]|nr:putative phage protein [Streptococcus equi subsp. equi]ASB96424.1 putative phage protein [Streptococcus equi subsp. equi]CRR04690.1 phage protein [Streptococcus equi subsp. equi]CRR20279.1 phage protein [Streptococcus equi subsp. equi]